MTRPNRALPHQTDRCFLTYTGMETDLIFTQGVALPGFASFPLLETEQGRALLNSYATELVDVAQANGHGVILEAATWMANRDRAAAIGYAPEQLDKVNRQAIAVLDDLRQGVNTDVLISANVGPRSDAYTATGVMSVQEAQDYHSAQMQVLAQTALDFATAYTLADLNEAIGVTAAAAQYGVPIVVSFTVETNGALPDGTPLEDAIGQVDSQTNGYPSYYMINCAHPEHFEHVLGTDQIAERLKGLVVNASRCSHAELDEAEQLDAGNPVELGQQMSALRNRHQQLRVFGGCCGTDMRHMREIAAGLR